MKRFFLFAAALVLAGCDKSPFERTTSSQGGAIGGFGGTASLTVFSDELVSGGGAFLYPGGENQALTFGDETSPLSRRSIRYAWNGRPPKAGDSSFTFAGFDLMHTATQAQYDAASTGRDLRTAGYTKVTFYARGVLRTRTVLKVEVADDGAGGATPPCLTLYTADSVDTDDTTTPCGTSQAMTGDWAKFTISVPNSALANVKDLFKATLVFNNPPLNLTPGQGGTVYFDQIYYEP